MIFSLIIPVYNRPDEVDELLESLSKSDYNEAFEIVLVEDGSSIPCRDVVMNYQGKLNISYYFKENSGPGDSRNFGMQRARGDYFIIFDSDCIIPSQYLTEVRKELDANYVDCFGGPDKALDSFSDIQKAINFAMTSFHQKNQILESLDSLDHGQTEKVLEYIRTLVHNRKDESAHQRLKREALKEIRLALGNDRKLRPFF